MAAAATMGLKSSPKKGDYTVDESTVLPEDGACESVIQRIAAIRGSEWIVVIFYGDESGTHGKDEYVISGYVAHKTTWEFFRKEWARALAAPTPRAIPYLKMGNWQHLQGVFEGWTIEEATLKLRHLLSVLSVVLKSGGMGEYTCSIPWDTYNRCIDGHCKKVFDNPYYLDLMQIVRRVMQFAKANDPSFAGKIDFVFDEGNSAEGDARKHFAYIKAFAEPQLADCMGSITFASDRGEPGLQIADALAWHNHRVARGIDPPNDMRLQHFAMMQNAAQTYARENIVEDGLIAFNQRVNTLIDNILAATGGQMPTEDDEGFDEFQRFDAAMEKLLKADPSLVKAAMDMEKKDRAAKRNAKRASASSPSSGDQG